MVYQYERGLKVNMILRRISSDKILTVKILAQGLKLGVKACLNDYDVTATNLFRLLKITL